MRLSDTLVFAPTYNERQNIAPLLDALLALPARPDVLIVDDRSADGTTEYLRARAATEPRLGFVLRPGKLGIGSAHKLAWLHARRLGYARFVTLDADLSHDPADVTRLLAALDAGADVAFGSRFAPGGRLDYVGWRLFLSRTANRLARLALRLPLAEHTTSLRAACLDRIPAGLVETVDSDGYAFFLACAARMVRHGLTVVEIPIHFRDRQGGMSKIPRTAVIRGAVNLLRLAVDRRPVRPFEMPKGSAGRCPSCGHPYRLWIGPGVLRCLCCFERTRRTGPAAARGKKAVNRV